MSISIMEYNSSINLDLKTIEFSIN